jgi:hypothetical protein
MPESADRERLRRLTEQKQQAKAAAEKQMQQQEADEVRRRAEQLAFDEQTTREVLDYCTATFVGYQFTQTDHELRIKRDAKPSFLGARDDVAEDGVDYVIVYADDVDGDSTAPIPFFAARFRHGQYELWDTRRPYTLATFSELREQMLDVISGMDDLEAMKRAVAHVRKLQR